MYLCYRSFDAVVWWIDWPNSSAENLKNPFLSDKTGDCRQIRSKHEIYPWLTIGQ